MSENPKIYFHWLQVGRFLAAFWVLLHHGQGQLFFPNGELYGHGVVKGHYGVDFFFTLSGFIIMYLNEKNIGNPSQVGTFLIKRINRILPLVFLLIAPRILQELMSGMDSIELARKSFADMLLLPTNDKHLINNAWSLRYEMVFYVSFALLMVFGRKVLWSAISLIVFLVVGTYLTNPDYVGEGINVYLFSKWNLLFIAGVITAVLEKKLRNHTKIRYGVLISMLIVGLYTMYQAGFARWHTEKDIYDVIGSSLAFSAVIMILCTLDYKGVKAPKILRSLGDSSYAIYLIHGSALFYLRSAVTDPVLKCSLSWVLVFVIFGVSYLVFRFYELPANRLLNRFFLEKTK